LCLSLPFGVVNARNAPIFNFEGGFWLKLYLDGTFKIISKIKKDTMKQNRY